MGKTANENSKVQEPVANRDQLQGNMLNKMSLYANIDIRSLIVVFRGKQTLVDRDVAMLYGVETKVLNQAVKRNVERFPEKFRFQLTKDEMAELVTNCDRFESLKHSTSAPYVFTEQGISMLSAVLHSKTAIAVSIRIMDAFVEMRHFMAANTQLFNRLAQIEIHQMESDKRIDELFLLLEEGTQPRQGVFFDGQIFDAYRFVSDLVRKALQRIVLIDNYIDDTVLTLLDKRAANVSCTIYTKHIGPQLQLDLNRHNAQYAPIVIEHFNRAHDRFLMIDDEVYHIGASLKDLGKKWFAFTLLSDITANELLSKI